MDNVEATPDAALDSVSKVFGDDAVAVDNISLEVRKGEFFSLLGPSGCGKSTTLRMLAGLEEPTSGRILIRGKDVTRVRPNRRPTNLIFQKLALFPHLSLAENIAYGPKVQRKSRQQIRSIVSDMLDLVELSQYANRLPSEISGGQQQRVAIARALANEPAVLLLDEPLGALDLKLRVQMQLALKKIQQDSGTTFIFVTHDQIEAMTMSDRMAVMSKGKIDQVGSPADLYNNPQTQFSATFLGDINLFHGVARNGSLESDGLTLRVPSSGTTAAVRPERISLGDTTASGDNSVDVRVDSITFQGAQVRVSCQASTNHRILVDVPAHLAAGLHAGQATKASWAVDSTVMLAG